MEAEEIVCKSPALEGGGEPIEAESKSPTYEVAQVETEVAPLSPIPEESESSRAAIEEAEMEAESSTSQASEVASVEAVAGSLSPPISEVAEPPRLATSEEEQMETDLPGPVAEGAESSRPLTEEEVQLQLLRTENASHPFVRVLKQFDLVAEKVLSFLNFEDIKALSETSCDIFTVVRKSQEYSRRARLYVRTEVIQNELLKESTHLWRHIKIDVDLPIELVDLIADSLEEAESVYLVNPSRIIRDDGVAAYLERVLRKTKELKTLGLDMAIVVKILHDVFANAEIQEVLAGLECLEIKDLQIDRRQTTYYIDPEDEDVEMPFQRNFLQLSLVPLKLKRFVCGKVESVNAASECDHVKFIPNIISANYETLEDLELHLEVWKFEEMKGIRCPKLKRLTLSTHGDSPHAKVVETFLKNQPPLEELTISMLKEFPISILLMLERMLMKMKKLHIKAKRFVGRSEATNWEFLRTMTELKDFSLRKPFGWTNSDGEIYGYGESILNLLPEQTVKISLQGFNHFWTADNIEPATQNIGELLARFSNLREVNLLRSEEAVTDAGLQTIISKCPKLVSLTFSHCSELTDFGITGVVEGSEEKLGHSLDELKGLVHLKIRSCPNISAEALLRVVTFPHLRSFDYYRSVVLNKEFLFQLARQNPCLENIALHVTTYEDDEEYAAELKSKIKELNPRVHRLEILEKADWRDNDSDSDASSTHSDFSGGNYRFDEFGDAIDEDAIDYDYDDEDAEFDDYYDVDGEDFDYN